MPKKCKHSIDISGQLSRCKTDNSLCCTYPQEKCPNFLARVFKKPEETPEVTPVIKK
ncbi:MAG: hypothetical protein KAS32_09590 [Candidatus Peribacteraceae bacterium]|nr:hypothetical protein [Candidatus Peribacteraceae bacterium]